jgi:galactose-1-phosphate uridylyltransferase
VARLPVTKLPIFSFSFSNFNCFTMFEGKWEKRWHPLREEWVVYAAHRNSRPWTTGTHAAAPRQVPAYDPGCYLCPGNARIHGARNPDYRDVYIFDNDHPVVGLHAPDIPPKDAWRATASTAAKRPKALPGWCATIPATT